MPTVPGGGGGGAGGGGRVFYLVSPGMRLVRQGAGVTGTPLVSFVDPTQVAFFPVDTVISDIDPTQVYVLPEDAVVSDIDPTQVTIIS